MPLERHPKGTNARVLLSSVFGPYARDDDYGSRSINPMELYHNQVTRVQGPFSLRMFHRSWGLMMIQANIDSPSTLLDFPLLDRFAAELRENEYDIVGISSIIPNVEKVRKMCSLVRELRPRCTIVVGGHVSNLPGLEQRIDADHIVRGDGISWFRRFLGQDESKPIEHPEILSGIDARTMGVRLSRRPGQVAAVLIPSVGCPMGCNFCATSSMFGGKGSVINFFDSGRELFDIMCRLETRMKVSSFFVMDENFLLYRKRALDLLGLMRSRGKSWSLYVFSSANALSRYTMEELVSLGISWVWLGLEGEDTRYAKLKRSDTRSLVRELRNHGIKTLGSSIIGLESHTPENIDAVIGHAVDHCTDFHQFMLYTPVAGTPLYREHAEGGTLRTDVEEADAHGQYRFNFHHPHISSAQSGEFLLRAFRRDFETNGPSIFRIAGTLLQGWRRHKNHPEARVRERFRRESASLRLAHPGALRAMEKYFERSNPALVQEIHSLRRELEREFGFSTKLLSLVTGWFLRVMIGREEKRLQRGKTYEPPSFIERRNWAAAREVPSDKPAVPYAPEQAVAGG